MHTPLHVSAANRLRTMISAGTYAVGTRLPSEPVLARELSISRATLREAFKQLESEGILHRVHGVGTFVQSLRPALSLRLSIPRSITEMIESLGLAPGVTTMRISTEPVYPDDLERLAVHPGSTVMRVERIRTANRQPVAYTIDVVPMWVIKKYPSPAQGENFSLIAHLKTHCGVTFGELTSVLMPLHNIASIAEKLEIDPSSHILFFEETDRNVEGAPVLSSREYFAPWIFRFTVKRDA
jgi:GntR family transcriptional regulator